MENTEFIKLSDLSENPEIVIGIMFDRVKDKSVLCVNGRYNLDNIIHVIELVDIVSDLHYKLRVKMEDLANKIK